MDNVKIKVCGMRDAANIRDILSLEPDYMGFIFYRPSKRYAGETLDASLLQDFPPGTLKTGVFVNEKAETIGEYIRKYGFDLVQLHGQEPPELCRELAEDGITLIKTFSMHPEFSFEETAPYKNYCRYFMFDTRTPGYGGSGKAFNWNLLKQYDQEIPFFLSGGIGPEHAEALKEYAGMNLHAVDLNSRFESSPGVKDKESIRKFMACFDTPAAQSEENK